MFKTCILILIAYVNCLEWIKLSPLKKEFTVTENILSYLTPDEDGETFVRLSNPVFSTKYDNVTATTVRPIMLSVKKSKYDNITILNDRNTENFQIGGFNLIDRHEIDDENIAKSVDKNIEFNNNSVTDPFTLKNFSPLLKSLQHNLFNKIPVALYEKTKLLQRIHDDILIHIENAINSLWPNKHRSKRASDDSDHHIDFPSSETALMTISFLTFAVYLIKLVLQVVNILKNKKMMYTPMVTGSAKGWI